MEDIDFSRRVSYKYKLFYDPQAKLEHKHTGVRLGSIRANRKMYMFNYRYLFFKNFYPRNRLLIVPHWWSIFGLIASSLISRSRDPFHGYLDGLREFKHRKGELLGVGSHNA